jgi:hypothetical protein
MGGHQELPQIFSCYQLNITVSASRASQTSMLQSP